MTHTAPDVKDSIQNEVIHKHMLNAIPVAIKMLQMAQDEKLNRFQCEVQCKAAMSVLNLAHM